MEKVKAEGKRIATLVLTGGPCAGKSTAYDWMVKGAGEKGWTTIFVPETATELINAGISVASCGSAEMFQQAIMEMQLQKEQFYRDWAQHLPAPKVLIVFDRGLMDGSAYVSAPAFQDLLRQAGLSADEARNRYQLVLHLVTTAKGAVEHYKTSNNTARSETPEEAAALDDRIIAAWSGHPHLRVIDNEKAFEHKMQHVLDEVFALLDAIDAK